VRLRPDYAAARSNLEISVSPYVGPNRDFMTRRIQERWSAPLDAATNR
jgi:hypothetical protein